MPLHHSCGIKAAGEAERLAEVLGQCRDLNLSSNNIKATGAERLVGVLGQGTALTHLDLAADLEQNGIEAAAC